MDPNLNDAVAQALGAQSEKKSAKPDKLPDPEPFKFKEGFDDVGLPHEHAGYVKKGCKNCNGSGYLTYLRVSGEEPTTNRTFLTCPCVHRRYTRVRTQLEKMLDKHVKEHCKDGEASKEEKKVIAAPLIEKNFPELKP